MDGGAEPRRRWHNAIPEWIVMDAAYNGVRDELTGAWRARPLSHAARGLLQVIADACDAPDAAGNLIGAWGGRALYERAGIDRATFWRQLKPLLASGFIIQIARGGTVRNRNIGNLYGVPGRRGSLAELTCRPRQIIMRPTADGLLAPQTLTPGDQATLWTTPAGKSPAPVKGALTGPIAAPQIATGVVANCDGGSRQLRPHHTPVPSPRERVSGDVAHLGGGGAAQKSGTENREPKTGLRAVQDAELTDLRSLRRRFEQAVTLRLVAGSEDGWFRFVAAAEHALRIGRKPAAVLAALVNQGRWLCVAVKDEQRAAARLRREQTR